ncbi:hypothetical protein BX666DRAFT_2041339, partial [Dichotomocladium elegans]
LSLSFSISTAGSNWNEVKPTGNIASEQNFLFSMVAVPSKHCFVVNGGLGYNNRTPLPYQTMAFNVSTSSWINIESGNQLQTRLAAMVIGNGDKIYIWGGNSDIYTGAANESYPSDMRILDFTVGTWTFIPYLNGTYNRNEHTATLSRDGRMIYYLGGLTATQYIDTNNTLQYARNIIDMSNIITFDTTNSSWGSVTTSSIALPTQRRRHTAERIPGTNTLLLYGGAQLVVFVDNTTLFVLFGIAKDGELMNTFSVLNVTSWSWIDTFSGLSSADVNQSSTSKTGAIAGGVMGGVVGVALITAALFFILKRKRPSLRREREGANANVIDDRNDIGGQSGILSFIDRVTYNSSGSEKLVNTQSPLFYAGGSPDDRTTMSSPTFVSKPDVYFGAPKLVIQPVKPDAV